MIKTKQMWPVLLITMIMVGLVVAFVWKGINTLSLERDRTVETVVTAPTPSPTSDAKPFTGFVYNPVLRVSRPSRSVFAPLPSPTPTASPQGIRSLLQKAFTPLRRMPQP